MVSILPIALLILLFAYISLVPFADIFSRFNPYYNGPSSAASTIGHSVYLGAYLALCFPISLHLFAWETSFNSRVFYGIASFIIFLCLIFTYTRGAWLAVAFALCIYMVPKVRIWVTSITRDRVIFALIVLCLFIPIALAVMQDIGLGHVIRKMEASVPARIEALFRLEETEPFRLAQYKTTLRVLKEHPLLGVGFGNFTRLFEQYKHPSTPSKGYIAATTENMCLMVICETGIVGFLSVLVLFFALVRNIHKGYRSTRPGPDRDLLLASLASFCGFMVNMVTWDALNQPTVRMTFWMLVGIALRQVKT